MVTVRLGASGSTEDNTSVEALRLIMPLKLSARDLLADLTASNMKISWPGVTGHWELTEGPECWELLSLLAVKYFLTLTS